METNGKTIFRFTFPITLISFGLITKWWFGLAVDAKYVFFYGFPMIYKCEGFHTSGSTQYFLLELLFNLMTYFIFWLLITFFITRFKKINIPKKIARIFWIGFGVFFAVTIFLSIELNDVYLKKRDFDVEIIDSGFTIFQIHSRDRERYIKEIKH